MVKESKTRKRAPSVKQTIHEIEVDPQHHLTGPFLPQTPLDSATSTRASSPAPIANGNGNGVKSNDVKPSGQKRAVAPPVDDFYESKGLWDDVQTLRWMRVPSSSFKMLSIPLVLYAVFAYFNIRPNPFEPMLFLSHYRPESKPDDPRYVKGILDLLFIAYHVVVFSFIRQFTLFHIIHPIARKLGIRKQGKLDRFGEQAYAVLYYGVMGVCGAFIMSRLPTWWYQTEHFWLEYPHWEMKPSVKRYYLMHFSYWIQQLVVLVLKIEKPRKDFRELCIHHAVTMWLIGWSYLINLTYIGNAVFVSMDIPDVFLAISKLCNYLQLNKTKTVTFGFFAVTWTYFRHWLNLKMLYSVWYEFDLMPPGQKVLRPFQGYWMIWWMKYNIFTPMLILQGVNLFWYYLILRILVRAIGGQDATDDRSDDEDDDEEDEKEE